MNYRTERFFGAVGLVVGVVACAAMCGCHGHQPAAAAAVQTSQESVGRLVSLNGQTALDLAPDSVGLAGVTTVDVADQELHSSIQPTGQIAATDSNSVEVMARLPGRIVTAMVGVGSQVHQGDVIATVDSVDLTQAESTYETASSHAQLAYDQLLQQKRLAGYGALSEQPVEDAKRAYAAAQAAVASDMAQIAVDHTSLTNTQQLLAMGEITHKPVEDAQNAYAQAQSARIQAEVTLNSTTANLTRTKTLFNGGVYSRQQLEDAQTAHDTAAASLAQSQIQEKLALDELNRQQKIYSQNLNGASSLQQAQSKLQQDQHTYQSDLTALELARKELARAEIVQKSGIPINQAVQQAQDTYDEALVALQGAANTLKLYGVTPGQGVAQLSNGDVTIAVRAPMDGVIAERSMVVGQLVDTSTPLVKIDNLDKVYVDAQVYEKDVSRVAVGDPIQVRVTAFPGQVFHGRVHDIGSEVSPDTRTLTVRTVISNPGWLLRPGMYATVVIGSAGGVKALSVPSDALLQEKDQQIVYVEIAPHVFSKRVVQIGAPIGGQIPVTSGLSPGDKVVVAGNELLESEQDQLQSEKGATA